MNETLITPAGLEQLIEELERLRTVGRQAMAERIRHAIATDADASANADYLAAREEQALLEARIARVEQCIEAASIAEPNAANGVVDLGERVLLPRSRTGQRHEYEVVGSLEADPAAGRISAASPLGRALSAAAGRRRRRRGAEGQLRFKIVAIEAAAA